MSKRYFVFLLLPFLILGFTSAQSIIDCRVVTGGITECNPYGSKFIRAKKIHYMSDRHKLIVVKTLPLPAKKTSTEKSSLAEMIESHTEVEETLRFKSAEKEPLRAPLLKEPVVEDVNETEIKEVKPTEQIEPKKRPEVATFRVDLMPYGGMKESGLGREGPGYAIQEMTEIKLVCFDIG